MNMFEMFTDEEKTYEYGDEELNSKIQNITYTSDTVRTSYIPRKDIVECGFLQDDVKVYLTFISTDISDFSENFSNEALTAIVQSDADCVEKFEEIFKMIFGINFDRTAIQDPYYGILRGTRYDKNKYVAFDVFYHNTQINVYFWSRNGWEVFEDIKIKKLANKMIDYDARLADSFYATQ